DDPGVQLQTLRPPRLPHGAAPAPLRDEGLVRDEDHGPVLDPVRDPLRARLRALLPLLLPVLPGPLMVLVVGAEESVVAGVLGRTGDEDVLVLDSSAQRLEQLLDGLGDPRVW